MLTSAGRLPFLAVIHVAGINMFWRSTEFSIRQSVRSVMQIVKQRSFSSVAFPLIGAGTGGKRASRVLQWMREELGAIPYSGRVTIVQYRKS